MNPLLGKTTKWLWALLLPAAVFAQADLPLERIAFGSCYKQHGAKTIWAPIIQQNPDAFLFIGDVFYANTSNMTTKRRELGALLDNPEFQKLRGTCPVRVIWDDNDYGRNDGGADYDKKAETQALFLELFEEPEDSPRRKRPGMYQTWIDGPEGKRTQIIFLDTRYFRSPLKKSPPTHPVPLLPDDAPDKTMLGPAQWAWLKAELSKPAELRLVISSIQVIARDHGYEKWANFPRERTRLLELIAGTKASGVVFLSGDRHFAELSRLDTKSPYPLYDLTSSSLNSPKAPKDTNRLRVGEKFTGSNFGMVRTDWSKPDPEIRLEIRDEQGRIQIEKILSLSELSPHE